MRGLPIVIVICVLLLAGLLWVSAPETPIPGTPAAAKPPTPSGTFVVRDAQLFDGERVWQRADVLVRDGLIAEVAESLQVAESVAVVDGSGRTLMPGLIDAHVHSWGGARRQMLRFGVTTALDMFTDPGQLAGFRRDRESLASHEEADVWSAGALVTARGGHGTQFGVAIDTYDDPAQASEVVRTRLASGSDFIKLVVDDGHAYGDAIDLPTLDAPRIDALLDATRAANTRAVVHVAAIDSALAVAAAGADGLVHVFSDRIASDAEVRALGDARMFVIPTLTVIAGLAGQSPGPGLADDPIITPWLDPAQRDTLRAEFPAPYRRESHLRVGLANVIALHRAGVPILAGTDAGNPGTAHGASMHGELRLLVDAGLTPLEALRSATSIPADRFGLADRGRIAVGLRADLLLLDGDPLTRIEDTRKIALIWKNGHALPRPPVDAPNGGDSVQPRPAALEALHSHFDEDSLQASHGLDWIVSTDRVVGGRSNAQLQRIADPGGGWLRVGGTLAEGAPYPWAGALLPVHSMTLAPADASALSEIRLRIRGEPRQLMVMLLTGEQIAGVPAMQMIEIGPQWRAIQLPLAAFAGADLQRLRAVSIAVGLPTGEFAFELDDFELR